MGWAFPILLLFLYFQIGYVLTGQAAAAHAQSWLGPIALDSWIPLVPAFIVFYILGYVLPFTSLFVVKRSRDRAWLFVTLFLIFTVSFLIFRFFPVTMQKTLAEGTDVLSKLTRLHQSHDTDSNCFPSLHVSVNVFIALLLIRKNPKHKFWVVPFTALIVLSTLFVKQHLVVDVVGGIALGWGAHAFYVRALKLPSDIRLATYYVSASTCLFTIGLSWSLVSRILGVLLSLTSQTAGATLPVH